jgi:hypothetical protein
MNHALFVVSVPQPVVIGAMLPDGQKNEFRIGGSLAWDLPAGADVKYLEHAGTGTASIGEAIAQNEARQVLLGARLLEPQKRAAEAAETLRLRQAGESATLSSVADTVSRGLSMALGWIAEWLAASPADNYITLNQDFADTEMTEADAEILMRRWQGGSATMEDMYLLYKKGGRIDPEITFEEWRVKLLEQGPPPPVLPDLGTSEADGGEEEEAEDKAA